MAGEKVASDDDFAGTDYSSADAEGNLRVKVICLGDSAVGKSKYCYRNQPPSAWSSALLGVYYCVVRLELFATQNKR
ncbi:hypothetical protein HPB47_026103 [Ixodes persulcatus]|uniref:Uncharacterized protein n=1 Tax=Ixodes persulcatus TaxID=34615 RepID=A0AC60PZN0_IXOPE|nr:hypothetical protein HPB47_026103 [Ixodes persulcatus]